MEYDIRICALPKRDHPKRVSAYDEKGNKIGLLYSKGENQGSPKKKIKVEHSEEKNHVTINITEPSVKTEPSLHEIPQQLSSTLVPVDMVLQTDANVATTAQGVEASMASQDVADPMTSQDVVAPMTSPCVENPMALQGFETLMGPQGVEESMALPTQAPATGQAPQSPNCLFVTMPSKESADNVGKIVKALGGEACEVSFSSNGA